MVKTSVIIPVYNEEDCILNCMKSLKKQTYKDFELILVDDGSNDKTREIIKEFMKKNKRVRLIEGEHKGPGFSRNLGVKKSKGKILVFVDADMSFHRNFLKHLLKPVLEGKVIGTENLQIASNPENIWSRCWGHYLNNEKYIGKEDREGLVFRTILKKEFEKMGGFDPSLGYADDLTFYYKYNLRPRTTLNAICYHKNPETLKEVYNQSKWIGASIENKFIQNKISPIFLILFSPFFILIITILRCIKKREYSIANFMLVFVSVRYFGTIKGIINKNYYRENQR